MPRGVCCLLVRLALQSRLAVNAVTMGNFEEPIKISSFVKDIFAGFSMVTSLAIICPSCPADLFLQLNLKNDALRRRYDSLKYDIKKIEEGWWHVAAYVLGN